MDLTFPEGVHYLASESYRASTTWGFNIGGLIFTIFALMGLVIIIINLISERDELVIVSGLLMFIVFGLLGLITYHENPVYNTQYLVTIEQYVPFNEIQKNYKIVSTKDNIVTLRPLTPVPWEGNKESN